MIQRIQSLYLLLASALMALTLFLPLASFNDFTIQLSLRAFALQSSDGTIIQSAIYMGVLLILSCALPLVTIFLFRRRMLQFRLCVVELVLLVGSLVMEVVYYFLSQRAFDVVERPIGSFAQVSIDVPAALPLASLLFVVLALRAIFRDELLIRSANRIR